MAAGIVVRALAPLLKDKQHDPCLVVMDEQGNHVISLLSGHLGGGNELARRVAAVTGGRAVITTASDNLGLVALDLWAAEQHLVADRKDMTSASALLVNKGELTVYSEVKVNSLPVGLRLVPVPARADLVISNKIGFDQGVVFQPKNLVVGVGCNRGTPALEFVQALDELFAELGLSPAAISNLASIDKKADENGLLAFAGDKWPIEFFSKEKINQVTGLDISPAAHKAVGAIGVAEPCALLSARTNILISRKRKWRNITMAVAEASFTLSAQAPAL
jgi:cobalt-precorrin 5A hydrolase